ncbi:hypothetical protein KBX50_04735 [Micromonospora sp. C51]|uniref:LexA family protein n=1 Tax=Micromonospora sp. C51 TaxID=2824879 RepID=UPI001B37C5DA|nr:hypothetical protein [Micromonospora sp. C51]MBQ1047795.1 hypothetical protein [Micromonospora sp. C51]
MTEYHLAPVRDGRADWDHAALLPALSKRQLHILAVIRIYTAAQGYPPSLVEIGAAVSLTPATVLYHLRQMRDKGYLRRENGKVRALVIADPPTVSESQLGLLAGGAP